MPLAPLHLPMARAEATVQVQNGASVRLPTRIWVSAKIPLQDFLFSANIPTGLGCAGLFSVQPSARQPFICRWLEWGTSFLARYRCPTRLEIDGCTEPS
jgi:hypothetical protein